MEEIVIMQAESKLHWQQLCEQASAERDSAKLLELVTQINDLLAEKRQRLEQPNALAIDGSALAPTRSAKTRILLADDNPRVRSMIKTILLEHDPAWEICEAESGQEALAKAPSLKPDLVILDLNLPDMPGYDTARQIRELSDATKIVICSSSDSAHLAIIAQHAGADGYFTKGSDPSELYQTIASLLGQDR
jgi:CheY-like chemotaxis protein